MGSFGAKERRLRMTTLVNVACRLPLCFCRFFLADAFADFEFHFASLLVSIDYDVVAVQNLSIQDLQS